MSHPTERMRKERTHQHRAFLLYAMQHPDRRSLRAVARATGRAESTLRGWIRRWTWDTRLGEPDTEQQAIVTYRRLYLKQHGAVELPEVRDNVAVPLSVTIKGEPPPTSVSDDIRAAEREVSREVKRRADGERALRDQHLKLVDGALGYIVGEMQAGRIRATLRDIPTLLTARDLLQGGGSGEAGVATETVRVRQTRAAGGDVIEAMWQDVDELRVIVGALRVREQVASAVVPAAVDLVALPGGQDAG